MWLIIRQYLVSNLLLLLRLWKEVEKLETDNIFMLTDMYDERMMDIKRSRYVITPELWSKFRNTTTKLTKVLSHSNFQSTSNIPVPEQGPH